MLADIALWMLAVAVAARIGAIVLAWSAIRRSAGDEAEAAVRWLGLRLIVGCCALLPLALAGALLLVGSPARAAAAVAAAAPGAPPAREGRSPAVPAGACHRPTPSRPP